MSDFGADMEFNFVTAFLQRNCIKTTNECHFLRFSKTKSIPANIFYLDWQESCFVGSGFVERGTKSWLCFVTVKIKVIQGIAVKAYFERQV